MKLHNFFYTQAVHSIAIMNLRGISLVVKFALTLFIARFMGFESLGLYGLITAASIMAPGFLGLGIIYTLNREAVTQTIAEITQALTYYGRYIIILYAFLLTAAILIGLVTGNFFMILAVSILIFFEHVNHDLYQLLLNLSRPFLANFLHFLRTALWAIIFMALAFFFPSLRTVEFLLIGWICGSVCCFLGFIWFSYNWPWGAKKFSVVSLKEWVIQEFRQSRTLYMNGFANTATQYLDRYLITLFLGLELTGIYVFFWQLNSALSNLLNTGIIQIARPKMVRAYKNREPAYSSIYQSCLKNTLLASIAMALAAGLGMYILIPYIDRPQAMEWFPILWIILVGFVLIARTEVQQLIFYSQHKDGLALIAGLSTLAGAVLFNLILIPILGLWGVGLSLIMVSLLRLVIQNIHIKPLIENIRLKTDERGNPVTRFNKEIEEQGFTAENKYIFFRNDQQVDYFEFDPKDPKCLDNVDYKYFGRALNILEPFIKDRGLTIYVTAWTVHELPSYGPNVIACILQDEWAREPQYRDKVGMVFRTCGKFPVNFEAYKYGDFYDIYANFLGQGKAIAKDGTGRLQTLRSSFLGKDIAPIYDIPLGCYAYEDIPFIPIEERTSDFFFAGSVQHIASKGIIRRPKELARSRMTKSLLDINEKHPDINIKMTMTGNFQESIDSDNTSYLKNMMNTKICPIPRGANLETFRFYEAIRYGCIPIGEAFPKAYFYAEAPIIRLKNWSNMKNATMDILKDKEQLQDLHERSLQWWKDTCSEEATANFMLNKISSWFSR
ncbi:MAG: hypothetical protein DHS20C02_20080 [Micavibrio sp.]|nr:MAG: hypothetical protein DHS20C02_20080 [Micavibrio sp.]